MKKILLFSLMLSGAFADARTKVDYKKIFGHRDGCFLITDLQTGKVVDEYNPKRCELRFSPYSTFKIPAAAMAFERGIFKNEDQVIKWDGITRNRKEINQDLTPSTFMALSAKWVTEWIMPQLGKDAIHSYLKSFKYGNEDFSGGLKDAWVSSSLKISAHEQVKFLSSFWNEKVGLASRSTTLTKKIIFIKKLGEKAELYGKTGTGCLVGNACLDRPDKMIGWFVGVLKTDSKLYAFAGNASDLKAEGPPAGPRMRETTIEILNQLNLIP